MFNQRKFVKVLLYLAMVLVAIAIFAPFYWLIISSVSTMSELLCTPPHWIPKHPTFDNYLNIFFPKTGVVKAAKIFMYTVRNSLIVAGGVTVISLILGSLAAYAFVRLVFPMRKQILISILATRMLPAISTMIPLYIIVTKFNLIDTKISLIILYFTFTIPYVIWIMTGFFRTIPSELEDAARIDGCSRLGSFLRVILPLSAPGLVATTVIAFMLAWDEFFFALIFTNTPNAKTVPVAITEFAGRHLIDYGAMCTGGVLASIPPVLLILIFYRFIVRGLTAGAVKG
ncbi:carbohydrate ABC transporter permease [Candidatus Aerophobetes bacterium]|nr:carbohydrate ABC transporter permease [Candidatus Aerophobetes bacterium]